MCSLRRASGRRPFTASEIVALDELAPREAGSYEASDVQRLVQGRPDS